MAAPRVLILLSTWNGARFLAEQLDSYLAQRDVDWHLFWRDDGSADDTVAILRGFAAGRGAGHCTELAEPAGHLGVGGSFFALLAAALLAEPDADCFAFSDQDDVWLPDKLARGAAMVLRDAAPALYCARSQLVDATLAPLGLSELPNQAPGFPLALTHNLATGCTIVLNQAAARRVGASARPSIALHDWWCYIVLAAGGGRIEYDTRPAVLYRQHDCNLVGVPRSYLLRGLRALRRGPGAFMSSFRGHLAALQAQPELLTPAARAQVARIAAALEGGVLRRLACLAMPGMRRQTVSETLVFYAWFLLG